MALVSVWLQRLMAGGWIPAFAGMTGCGCGNDGCECGNDGCECGNDGCECGNDECECGNDDMKVVSVIFRSNYGCRGKGLYCEIAGGGSSSWGRSCMS